MLATPALAQSVAEKTGLNSVLGTAPITADFVKEAASSDLFEIQSSQLAAQRADAPTKAFPAEQMITDHQKTNPDLKAWTGSTLPVLQHHLQMAQALDK